MLREWPWLRFLDAQLSLGDLNGLVAAHRRLPSSLLVSTALIRPGSAKTNDFHSLISAQRKDLTLKGQQSHITRDTLVRLPPVILAALSPATSDFFLSPKPSTSAATWMTPRVGPFEECPFLTTKRWPSSVARTTVLNGRAPASKTCPFQALPSKIPACGILCPAMGGCVEGWACDHRKGWCKGVCAFCVCAWAHPHNCDCSRVGLWEFVVVQLCHTVSRNNFVANRVQGQLAVFVSLMPICNDL